MQLITDIVTVILGYILGSIPFGLLIVKLKTGKDLRTVESGRTGGTNAARAAGFWAGLLTAILDILKGAGAVWLAKAFDPTNHVLHILAPIGAMLIQFAVFRQREFEADRVGALILGRPEPLAHALVRLDSLAHRIPMQVAPAAAPLAQVNPLASQSGGLAKLFSTHPPTAERVARLGELAQAR